MIAIVAGVLAVLLAGSFAGLLVAGRPLAIGPDPSLPFELDDGVRAALGDALLAPSSHNAQMWRIAIDPEEQRISLRVDPGRQLREVDPEARESFISLGALTESLRRSLTARGYAPDLSIAATPDTNGTLVTVRYRESAATPDDAELALFAARHTDKRPFANRALSLDAVDSILAAAPQAATYWPAGSEGFEYLKESTIAATEAQNSAQSKRDELATWLRFSDDEARRLQDGLPAEQLGITGLRKSLYYLTTNAESARADAFAGQGLDRARSQLEGAAGFVVVSGGEAPEDLVRAGMDLQAIWLEATRARVSVQPMSQILEEQPWAASIGGKLGLDGTAHMILRVGYTDDYGANAGIRRDLAEVVEKWPRPPTSRHLGACSSDRLRERRPTRRTTSRPGAIGGRGAARRCGP